MSYPLLNYQLPFVNNYHKSNKIFIYSLNQIIKAHEITHTYIHIPIIKYSIFTYTHRQTQTHILRERTLINARNTFWRITSCITEQLNQNALILREDLN